MSTLPRVALFTDVLALASLTQRKGACILLSSRGTKTKVLLYRTTPATTPVPVADHDVLLTTAAAPAAGQKQLKQRVVVNESDMESDMRAHVIDTSKRLLEHYLRDADVESMVAQALKVRHRSHCPPLVSLCVRIIAILTVADVLLQYLLLQHSLTFTYGHTWHIIVSSSRELCCVPHFTPSTLADVSIDKFRIVVYRHASAPLDTRIDVTQFGNRAALLLALMALVVYGYFVFTATDADQRCVHVKDADGNNRVAVGCKLADVVRANTRAAWKGMALFATMLCTVIASLLRIYRSSLRAKATKTA